MTKEAFSGWDAAEMAAYMIPVVGGLMSAKDAVKNVGGMGKALVTGNWRKLGTQGLKFGGNALMALADFIPGGSLARGAVRGGKLAKFLSKSPKLAKLFKNVKIADKIGDTAGTAKGAIGMADRNLKSINKFYKKKMLPKSKSVLDEVKHFASYTPKTRVTQAVKGAKQTERSLVSLKRQLGKAIDAGDAATQAVLANRIEATELANTFYKRVVAAGTGLGGKLQWAGMNTGANLHGYGNHLMNRVAPWVGNTAAQVAKRTRLNSFGKMQGAGLLVNYSGEVPEALGWAAPRQSPIPPLGRAIPPSPWYT